MPFAPHPAAPADHYIVKEFLDLQSEVEYLNHHSMQYEDESFSS
jgi:hypothetical protein